MEIVLFSTISQKTQRRNLCAVITDILCFGNSTAAVYMLAKHE
jgi:hypothetical protein